MNVSEAVTREDVGPLNELLRNDPSIANQLDEEGLPPLYTAARHRNAAAIGVLLAAGAKLDIFACCYLNENERGRKLLHDNSDLAQSTTVRKRTALHFACEKGNLELARHLVDAGADVNAIDDQCRTPLEEAAHGGPWKPAADQQLIKLLIEAGAVVDFHLAAAIGRDEILSEHVAGNDNIDRFDANGFTALYHAAHNDHLGCVQLLLANGADPNCTCNDGQTALSTAALHLLSQQCDPQICRALIEAGAPFDIHTAAALGDVDQVTRLLDESSDDVDLSMYGFRPADYAVHCGQLETLRKLLECGADPSAKDDWGYSLLDKSAHLPALHQLLQQYAS